ncbi:MAG TPA: copper transporter [Mycobacterium sp.]|nr:copper transporter [Mycobacterium sp.]
MITLRHYVVSLVAMFVALIAGVVLGSGVFSRALVAGLQDEKQGLAHQIDALHGQENALNEKLGAADSFVAQMGPRVVHDALLQKSVVIFRTPDAHDDDVARMTQLVGEAGGRVTATVSLTSQFVDGNDEEKLNSVVNSSIVPAGAQLNTKLVDQGSQAGDLLGIALLINRNPDIPAVDDVQRETVLASLRDTGFLTYRDRHVGPADAALVITGGALPDDAGNAGGTVARFAAALAPRGSGVVLAGRDGCATGVAAVAVARADAGITAAISTVDNVDAASGRITVVMAVSELIGGGHPGQYGVGHGAGSLTVV